MKDTDMSDYVKKSLIGTAAGVASDMLKSVPIFSATTIKRCEVEQKGLMPYWPSEKNTTLRGSVSLLFTSWKNQVITEIKLEPSEF